MDGQTSNKILQAKLQRQLRNAPTDAEYILWQHLRGKQLDDARFRRQHPYEDYILDFVCLSRKIVVELDGGQHAEHARYDAKRNEVLVAAGFVVLRFWNHDVFENIDGVLEVIWNALVAGGKPSPPCPPLEGEGSVACPPLEGEGDRASFFDGAYVVGNEGTP
jgi:very-short-patch-repair endonuclease